MKKILLIIGLLAYLIPCINARAEIFSGDNCGNNCSWSFDTQNGILTIMGTGKMNDDSPNIPWQTYQDQIKKVTIKDGITSIGRQAFYAASNLESVDIPNSVEQIGDWAFARNEKLTDIQLPNNPNFKTIPDYAFSHSGLMNVEIPQNVTFVGDWAFSGCNNLKNILIPDSVNFMDNGALNALPQDTKIYCQGEERCNTLLEKFENNALQLSKLVLFEKEDNLYKIKDLDGKYTYFASTDLMINGKKCTSQKQCQYILDAINTHMSFTVNGKFYDSTNDWVKGNYIKKRSYTPAEAAQVVGDTNTLVLHFQ